MFEIGPSKKEQTFNYDWIGDWGNHNESLPIIAVRNIFERSFSKFNVIKTFHRSSMTDDGLTNLEMMSIESETIKTKIRYDWVDKSICIFENLAKVISR